MADICSICSILSIVDIKCYDFGNSFSYKSMAVLAFLSPIVEITIEIFSLYQLTSRSWDTAQEMLEHQLHDTVAKSSSLELDWKNTSNWASLFQKIKAFLVLFLNLILRLFSNLQVTCIPEQNLFLSSSAISWNPLLPYGLTHQRWAMKWPPGPLLELRNFLETLAAQWSKICPVWTNKYEIKSIKLRWTYWGKKIDPLILKK